MNNSIISEHWGIDMGGEDYSNLPPATVYCDCVQYYGGADPSCTDCGGTGAPSEVANETGN
jgi:hypothetical protein